MTLFELIGKVKVNVEGLKELREANAVLNKIANFAKKPIVITIKIKEQVTSSKTNAALEALKKARNKKIKKESEAEGEEPKPVKRRNVEAEHSLRRVLTKMPDPIDPDKPAEAGTSVQQDWHVATWQKHVDKLAKAAERDAARKKAREEREAARAALKGEGSVEAARKKEQRWAERRDKLLQSYAFKLLGHASDRLAKAFANLNQVALTTAQSLKSIGIATGLGSTRSQNLTRLARLTNVSPEALTNMTKTMQSEVAAMRLSGGQANPMWSRLGITPTDIDKGPEVIISKLQKKLAGMSDRDLPTARYALGQMGVNDEAFQALVDSARRGMTPESRSFRGQGEGLAASNREFLNAWTDLKDSFLELMGKFGASAGKVLTPVLKGLTKLLDWVHEAFNALGPAGENFVGTLLTMGSVFGVVGGMVAKAAGMLRFFSAAFNIAGLGKTFGTLTTSLKPFVSGLGRLAAVLGRLGGMFAWLTGTMELTKWGYEKSTEGLDEDVDRVMRRIYGIKPPQQTININGGDPAEVEKAITKANERAYRTTISSMDLAASY